MNDDDDILGLGHPLGMGRTMSGLDDMPLNDMLDLIDPPASRKGRKAAPGMHLWGTCRSRLLGTQRCRSLSTCCPHPPR